MGFIMQLWTRQKGNMRVYMYVFMCTHASLFFIYFEIGEIFRCVHQCISRLMFIFLTKIIQQKIKKRQLRKKYDQV